MKLDIVGGEGITIVEDEDDFASANGAITVTMPSAPIAGQIFYNSNEERAMMYDGNQWVEVADPKWGHGPFQEKIKKYMPHPLDRIVPSNYADHPCNITDKALEDKYEELKEMRKEYKDLIKQNKKLAKIRKEYDELQEKYVVFETLAMDHTEET